ncbi:MAG: glycosyltransferase family 4 protein [Alsobacter sp.]
MTRAIRPVLHYAPDGFETKIERPMGRQHAGHGVLRAFVAGREGPVTGMAIGAAPRAGFEAAVREVDPAAPVDWLQEHEWARLPAWDVLHLPGPDLSAAAAKRDRLGAASFSLSGVTHTIASDRVMQSLAAIPASRVMPWDAVICTSSVVRSAVETILARQEDLLSRRLGATRFPRPMLPVVPLGVHAVDFAFDEHDRARARLALGIAEDEVVACYVGRLSFHAKAHPAAMYEALEAAAARTGRKITLVEAGWFANPSIEKAFAAGRLGLAPSIRSIVTDGRAASGRAQALAAADIFVSLADNIQETFGLTPLEGMASGLPVVVTDWDGYRDTVRDGVDGFRVPTAMPASGAGEAFAARYERGTLNYDQYCCVTCLSVAVDLGVLVDRLAALVSDAGLRRRMGEAGRAHVRSLYDWTRVYGLYKEVWRECEALRRAAASAESAPQAPASSLDPFELFASYPTRTIGHRDRLRRLPGAAAWQARLAAPLFAFADTLVPEVVAVARTLMEQGDALASDTLGEHARRAGLPLDSVLLAAGLLAKLGVAAIEG